MRGRGEGRGAVLNFVICCKSTVWMVLMRFWSGRVRRAGRQWPTLRKIASQAGVEVVRAEVSAQPTLVQAAWGIAATIGGRCHGPQAGPVGWIAGGEQGRRLWLIKELLEGMLRRARLQALWQLWASRTVAKEAMEQLELTGRWMVAPWEEVRRVLAPAEGKVSGPDGGGAMRLGMWVGAAGEEAAWKQAEGRLVGRYCFHRYCFHCLGRLFAAGAHGAGGAHGGCGRGCVAQERWRGAGRESRSAYRRSARLECRMVKRSA